MAKTAMSQLENQIELVRREAFAAGYAAAMQAIREIASCPAPAEKLSTPTAPARRGDRLASYSRLRARRRHVGHALTASPQQTAANAGRMRGSSRRHCERAPRWRSARPRSAPPCSATKACQWPLRRSAMRLDSWRLAKRLSRTGMADGGSPDDRTPPVPLWNRQCL